MKNKMKKMLAGMLCLMMVLALGTGFGAETVSADSNGLYLALGADLTEEEKNVVLSLLEVTDEEMQYCETLYVTNEDEHNYLDSYISSSIIGSRALSSVAVRQAASGHGINVTTKNISYCTVGMYENALATAGVTDADIIVAGPFNLSGTAALVGAMKAYSSMSGTVLEPENIETATEELVTTGQLAEAIGSQEKAEELIAAVKSVIVAENITDPEDIRPVIETAAEKLNIQLTESEINTIIELMKKIAALDIDVDQLEMQLKGLYERLDSIDLSIEDLKLDIDQANGVLGKILHFLRNVWRELGDLLNS